MIKRILISVLIVLTILQFSYADDMKVERVQKFIQTLNYGAAATMNDISFSCHNPEAYSLVLVVKTLNQCLECNDCLIQMDTFLGESFMLISEVWFKTFGSYRMNITNKNGKVVFIINKDHELLKPMPLPEYYL